MQEGREGCIARADGGGPNANGSHVAQKLGKTRQNGPYGVFRGPPIPTYTPAPKNPVAGRLGPFPAIPPSSENPDSRPADETPTDYPVPAAHGSTPVRGWIVRAARRSAKTPHAAGFDSSIIKRL